MFRRRSQLDKARAAWDRGEHVKALELARAQLAEGYSSEAAVQLALWQWNLGDRVGATQHLLLINSTLQLDGKQPTPAPEDIECIKAFMDALEPTSAAFDPVVRLHTFIATHAQDQIGAKAAGRLFRSALQREPNYLLAAVGLGQALLALNAAETCLELLDGWLETFPNALELYQIGIAAASATGDADLANDYRHGLLLLDPTQGELLPQVGPWLRDRGDLVSCIELYETALALHPQDGNAAVTLGYLYLDKSAGPDGEQVDVDALRGAVRAFRIALQINPNQPQTRASYDSARKQLMEVDTATGEPESDSLAIARESGDVLKSLRSILDDDEDDAEMPGGVLPRPN